MPRKKVAIVGLGATGAFAAKAAFDEGCDVTVYVHGESMAVTGPVWFHWIPVDLQSQFHSEEIYTVGLGTAKQYRKLQWGDFDKFFPLHDKSNSFPETNRYVQGYNPAKVMDALVPSGVDVNKISYPMSDAEIEDLTAGFDVVFQTFPTQQSKLEQPPLVPFVMATRLGTEDPDVNYLIYNGSGEGIVLREASLFGNVILEFPKNLPLSQIQKAVDLTGFKVIEAKDIHPASRVWPRLNNPKIRLIGRWAEWQPKRLSHEIYSIVRTILITEVR